MEKVVKPDQIVFQEEIERYLAESLKIFTTSVFFTKIPIEMVSITFMSQEEFFEFLGILKYESLCDKSGFTLFQDTNTLILFRQGLTRLFDLWQ